jgi:uncharacterized protein (TIGR03435 family)
MKNVRTILDRFLERYGKPPVKDMESAGERVWKSVLAGEGARLAEPSPSDPIRPTWRLRWPVLATGVAALVLAVFLPATVLRSAPAVFEDGAGSRNIQYGELVRSNGGGTLKFTDGARVEMRAESEVSFERSGDGVLVRVRKGDVIANAAELPNGQVHVETKDMSVVGSVFLVNAKEEGSRVSSITGETRVQQGATEKKLLPGEQVATSPGMGSLPMKEGIGWSRQAEAQLALLQQGAAPAAVAPAAPQEKFEVASIRLRPVVDGGRGVTSAQEACPGMTRLQIDPRRISIPGASLQSLIVMAYPEWATSRGGGGEQEGSSEVEAVSPNCTKLTAGGILTGGPAWVRSEWWDIEATIPEGPVEFTVVPGAPARPGLSPNPPVTRELGPRVRRMLQNLLADRFGLVLRPQTKEMPVYLLTVGKDGFKPNGNPGFAKSASGEPLWINGEPFGVRKNIIVRGVRDVEGRRVALPRDIPEGATAQRYLELGIWKSTMSEIAQFMMRETQRPVLDRTNLSGTFDFHLDFDRDGISSRPTIFKALEEVGLKLESGRAPVEIWVIERAEKPSEN